MAQTVRSVLHEVQEAQGATFRDDDGWWWTASFGDGDAGYRAVRGGAAIWDVYPLVKWDVTGPDAAAGLQAIFSRDMSTHRVGTVRYGAFLDEDGTFLDDGTVVKHAEDHFWMLTNSDLSEHWAAHTQGLDFRFEIRTHEMPLISVQGPRSREILQSLTETDLSPLKYFNFLPEPITIGGVRTWLMRTGFSGEIGYELIPAREDAVALWTAVCDAGAVPMGLDTLEPVRIEAGLIIYAQDYYPGEHTPYDVSLDALVALDSDAQFVGKAALAAVAEAPPRRFKTLRWDGADLPEDGADVLADGAVVGLLTSSIVSPEFGAIGLAQIDTALADDGTVLDLVIGEGTVAATVAPLSIKDPGKTFARG